MKAIGKFVKISITVAMALSLVTNYSKVCAATYVQNWNLVDSGKHLDYDGNSIYMGNIIVGVGKWEMHRSGVIRKDSLTVIQDVYVSDTTRNDGVIGVTSPRGTIEFNKNLMEQVDSVYRSRVATHELGHALGLDHSTSSDIMYAYTIKTSTLSENDKNSYDHAYYYKY